MPCALLLDLGDTPDTLNDVHERLSHLGWAVLRATGVDALSAGLRFDLVLLHLPRPVMRSAYWQTVLHACGTTPALLLMDPPDPMERLISLELGAAAAMLAPFDMSEVVAQAQAVWRRTPSAEHVPSEAALMRDWLRQAIEAGQWGLSACERLVLRALLDHPGRVMSRGELLHCTGLGHLGRQPNVVDLAVSRLRRKLPNVGVQAQGIRTLRGRGYVWAVDGASDEQDAPQALRA